MVFNTRPASAGARRRWSGPPVASDNEPHPSATHRLPVFMPASPIARSTHRVARPARPEYRVLSSSPSAVHQGRRGGGGGGGGWGVVDHGPRFRVPPV